MPDTTKDLYAGLKNKSPQRPDSSMELGKGSVDNDPVRKSVASSPKTLGPRTA